MLVIDRLSYKVFCWPVRSGLEIAFLQLSEYTGEDKQDNKPENILFTILIAF